MGWDKNKNKDFFFSESKIEYSFAKWVDYVSMLWDYFAIKKQKKNAMHGFLWYFFYAILKWSTKFLFSMPFIPNIGLYDLWTADFNV